MAEPDALTALANELAQTRAELVTTRSEARLARRSYRFTITLLIVAIGAGGWLFWSDHRQDVERERADRQYELDQCERGNATREAIADIVDTQTDALITASAPADGITTPRRQASVDLYRSKVDPIVNELRTDRDCVALLEEGNK